MSDMRKFIEAVEQPIVEAPAMEYGDFSQKLFRNKLRDINEMLRDIAAMIKQYQTSVPAEMANTALKPLSKSVDNAFSEIGRIWKNAAILPENKDNLAFSAQMYADHLSAVLKDLSIRYRAIDRAEVKQLVKELYFALGRVLKSLDRLVDLAQGKATRPTGVPKPAPQKPGGLFSWLRS